MTISLDRVLAAHCAPVLAGKKPGALFTAGFPARLLRPYAELLAPCGIHFAVLGESRGRELVYVYRPRELAPALRQERTARVLKAFGYPAAGSLGEKLAVLQRRTGEAKGFPHEIGFFLGYPIEDVIGFMQKRGRGYKLCGAWKVYGDVEAARAAFREYERCKNQLVRFVEGGGSICRFVQAAS